MMSLRMALLMKGLDLIKILQQLIMTAFIQGQVQDDIQKQSWKLSSLYDLKKQVPIPKQTQSEMTRIIQDSHVKIKNLNERQNQILLQLHNARQIQHNTFRSQDLLTIDNINLDRYISFSAMGMISDFVYGVIKNLIQIQAQIDPVTQKLVTINSMPVIQLVSLLLSSNNIWSQLNHVISIYDDDVDRAVELGLFVQRVLQFIYRKAQSLAFAISIAQFQAAVYNQKILTKVNIKQATVIQTEALQMFSARNEKSPLTINLSKFYRVKFIDILRNKRQRYMKKEKAKFWKRVKEQQMKDIQTMIQQNIESQLQTIQTGIVKRLRDGDVYDEDYEDQKNQKTEKDVKRTKMIKKEKWEQAKQSFSKIRKTAPAQMILQQKD